MEKSNLELLRDIGIDVRRSGKTICPECSHKRKKKKDPCLSVNVEEGLYRCHNCGWNGKVFNKREYSAKPKEYTRPQFINNTNVSTDIVNWFGRRGITPMTVQKFKISENVHFFPVAGENRTAINFNYFRDDELVNVKYRDHEKNFMLHKGAELIFYNLDSIKDAKTVTIVEGECFTGDAEILTENGWITLKDYKGGKVMQVSEDLKASFVDPLCKVKKEYKGNLIEYSNRQRFYSKTTPDHNLVVINRGKKLSKVKSKDLNSTHLIPRTVNFSGKGIDLSDDEIRFCVAVSADFSIRESGDLYCHLKKERKKERLESLLNRLGIPFSMNLDSRNYWSFFIRRSNNPGYLFKIFPHIWMSTLSKHQISVIIDEVLFWDGNSVPDRRQIEYSSKEYSNAVFIQTISHLCGYVSTIIPRKNNYGSWFKVSILFEKKHTDSQSLLKNKKEINFDGFVYCVQVESGKILVRQNDCISISGNCDAMIVDQVGINAVVSVPNGASLSNNPNLEYLDNCIHYFDQADKIIIATDNDEAGRKLREELARRLGKYRCYKVNLADQKDSNDYYLRYGPEHLKSVFKEENLIEYPIDGIVSVADVWEDVEYLFEHGLQKGEITGVLPKLDNHVSFVGGHTMVVTGIPNHGKSHVVLMIQCALSVRHGWKWGMFSPEHKPLAIFIAKMCEMLLGKRLRPGIGFMKTEKDLARDFLKEHFYFIEPEDNNNTIENVLSKARDLVIKFGIKGFVADPWNKFEHKMKSGENETTYISRALDDIIYFGQNHGVFNIVVAHPTKIRKNLGTGMHEVPTLYDIAGSANFYNKPDWGLCVYRNYKDGVSTIHIQKSKWEHLGKVGSVDLRYNINNSRYTQLDQQYDNSNWLLPETMQGDLFADKTDVPEIILTEELEVVDARQIEDGDAPF